jgi:hypothetical protein
MSACETVLEGGCCNTLAEDVDVAAPGSEVPWFDAWAGAVFGAPFVGDPGDAVDGCGGAADVCPAGGEGGWVDVGPAGDCGAACSAVGWPAGSVVEVLPWGDPPGAGDAGAVGAADGEGCSVEGDGVGPVGFAAGLPDVALPVVGAPESGVPESGAPECVLPELEVPEAGALGWLAGG